METHEIDHRAFNLVSAGPARPASLQMLRNLIDAVRRQLAINGEQNLLVGQMGAFGKHAYIELTHTLINFSCLC